MSNQKKIERRIAELWTQWGHISDRMDQLQRICLDAKIMTKDYAKEGDVTAFFESSKKHDPNTQIRSTIFGIRQGLDLIESNLFDYLKSITVPDKSSDKNPKKE